MRTTKVKERMMKGEKLMELPDFGHDFDEEEDRDI